MQKCISDQRTNRKSDEELGDDIVNFARHQRDKRYDDQTGYTNYDNSANAWTPYYEKK